MIKILRIFFLLVISTSFSFSQKGKDFLNFNYSIIPSGVFKDKNIKSSLNQFEFNLITPTIKIGSKVKINNGLYYRFSNYQFEHSADEALVLPEKVHEIKYSLIARLKLKSNAEIIVIPRFSVRTDFEKSINNMDLFPAISSIIMKTSKKNENLKWGIGLNYNNDFGKNSIIPVLAFNYLNEKLRFSTFFPSNANLVFLPSKKIEYGFGFVTDPSLFHVNELNEIEYIRILNVNLSSTFSYNLKSNFWLNFKTGLLLHRKYDLYDNDFEIPNDEFENKLKPSLFALIGFSFRSEQ